MSHRSWIQADRERFGLASQWRRLFENWDVVLCPAAPTVAFDHDARPFDQRTLMIDGADRTPLTFAALLENALDGFERPSV
jgi:amidase